MIKVKYLSKRSGKAWRQFGAPSRDKYEKWNPEVCGICCLKMIGDTFGLTNHASLYSLALKCLAYDGYKITPSGEIKGVFHKPLLDLAKNLGLDGQVERKLPIKKIVKALIVHDFVILSINKSKVDASLSGGHLILVHEYNPIPNTFTVHDPEPILSDNGENIVISSSRLQEISNNKGLVIRKRKDCSRLYQ